MIEEYVTNFAVQKGIQLSEVRLVKSRTDECLDAHLLYLVADNHQISLLVYQAELEELQNGSCAKRLIMKLRTALSRL